VSAALVPRAESNEAGAAAGKEQKIQLKVKVVEYSRTELRRKGVDITESFGKQVQGDGLAPILAYMRKNNLMLTFAEPTLITAEGRPVHFDGPDRFGRKLGTELTFTPTLLDAGRVRVNLRTATTEVDRKNTAANRRSMKPAFKTSETDRYFELELGTTVVCPGRAASAMQQVEQETAPGIRRTTSSRVETQMLYIVTPELVADEK
jgi:Flp pilus assembly secretin CpaC